MFCPVLYCFVRHRLFSGSSDNVSSWFQLVRHASYQLGCFILMCVRYKRLVNSMVDSGCEGGNNNQDECAKKKRALFLVDCINEYNEVARATKDIKNYLKDSTVKKKGE